MHNYVRRIVDRLARCRSGNATLLLAMGMPMLIGGAGLSVDTAQWYLWKRDLQFAVDQAAIAGAWAKAQNTSGTSYIVRAQQEYDAAIGLVEDFDTAPEISLSDYDGGTNNSVLVSASATRPLPFSSFLTGSATTVAVHARAIYEPGATYKPCLMALDEHASSAMLFNGTVTVTASCGVGALSDSATSVVKLGSSGNIDVGFVVTAGNIDDAHGHFSQEERVVNAGNLKDPYEELTPPNDSTSRTLSCPANNNKYTADETVQIKAEYAYFKGKNKNSLTAYTYPNPKATTTSAGTTTLGKSFNSAPANSQTVGNPSYTEVSGGGNDKIWERETLTTMKTYSNIVAPYSGPATALPGTYTDFTINCDTVLSSGVYVLNNTTLQMAGQHKISGTGVMLVLKNGAGVKISGGAMIDLTAMSESQLIAAGVPSDDAVRMLGMLIFEDPNSAGAADNEFTGNSTQILNGVVYMPKSDLKIAGTPQGTSQCMVLAVKTLQFSGTVDVSTLCPANATPNAAIADTGNTVRLVG